VPLLVPRKVTMRAGSAMSSLRSSGVQAFRRSGVREKQALLSERLNA
jgi:hypothetical protein